PPSAPSPPPTAPWPTRSGTARGCAATGRCSPRGRSASTRCTTSSTTCTTSAPRSESVDPPVARGSTTAAWGDLLRADGAATAPARFLHSGDVRQLLGGRGAAACAARRPGRARGTELAVVAAVALAVVLVPQAWRVARLGVTLVHELGHAVVGVAVGRRFTGFVLRG